MCADSLAGAQSVERTVYARIGWQARGKICACTFLVIKYVNSLCLLSLSDCSELVMYADALVLYKPISTEGDCVRFAQIAWASIF